VLADPAGITVHRVKEEAPEVNHRKEIAENLLQDDWHTSDKAGVHRFDV
jgi:hypothetical protein